MWDGFYTQEVDEDYVTMYVYVYVCDCIDSLLNVEGANVPRDSALYMAAEDVYPL